LMPAQHLEARVPGMKKKGRIAIGADADITIFNPNTVIDRSTYREPSKPSEGIDYVLVNGVLVVDGGRLRPNVLPGRGIRAPINSAAPSAMAGRNDWLLEVTGDVTPAMRSVVALNLLVPFEAAFRSVFSFVLVQVVRKPTACVSGAHFQTHPSARSNVDR